MQRPAEVQACPACMIDVDSARGPGDLFVLIALVIMPGEAGASPHMHGLQGL